MEGNLPEIGAIPQWLNEVNGGNGWYVEIPSYIVLKASDDDSKKFKITVNSTGAITVTEVTS